MLYFFILISSPMFIIHFAPLPLSIFCPFPLILCLSPILLPFILFRSFSSSILYRQFSSLPLSTIIPLCPSRYCHFLSIPPPPFLPIHFPPSFLPFISLHFFSSNPQHIFFRLPFPTIISFHFQPTSIFFPFPSIPTFLYFLPSPTIIYSFHPPPSFLPILSPPRTYFFLFSLSIPSFSPLPFPHSNHGNPHAFPSLNPLSDRHSRT